MWLFCRFTLAACVEKPSKLISEEVLYNHQCSLELCTRNGQKPDSKTIIIKKEREKTGKKYKLSGRRTGVNETREGVTEER